MPKLKKSVKITLYIILIIVIALLSWKIKSNIDENNANRNLYYAVFLNNGQVYFGNMKNNTEGELVLTNVYYLQLEKNDLSTQAQLSGSMFSLIKMGNEIHGPTNEMFINKQNVLFYEKLRDDSKVVKSILDNK